jgi:hypothetical protein
MRNRVSICTLIIGLICPFTQVAREPRAAGAIWDDWRKVRRRRRTPFRIGQGTPPHFGSGVHGCGGADLNRRPLGYHPVVTGNPCWTANGQSSSRSDRAPRPNWAPHSGRLGAFSCLGNDRESEGALGYEANKTSIINNLQDSGGPLKTLVRSAKESLLDS